MPEYPLQKQHNEVAISSYLEPTFEQLMFQLLQKDVEHGGAQLRRLLPILLSEGRVVEDEGQPTSSRQLQAQWVPILSKEYEWPAQFHDAEREKVDLCSEFGPDNVQKVS